jgi:hypothetical protein
MSVLRITTDFLKRCLELLPVSTADFQSGLIAQDDVVLPVDVEAQIAHAINIGQADQY